jgi:hypothetical protein
MKKLTIPSCITPYLKRSILIPTAIIAALGLGTVETVPLIKDAYKKHKAQALVTETCGELANLETLIQESNRTITNNTFLMTGPQETAPLFAEIEHASGDLVGIKAEVAKAQKEFDARHYDSVRTQLDNSFGLPKGQTRITPSAEAQQVEQELKAKVIKYCDDKRNSREAAITNEWFLAARLKTPLPAGTQKRPARLAELPDNFYAMIPVLNPQLEAKLKEFGAEYNNSLGANLANHEWTFYHLVEFGVNDTIKQRAKQFYDAARTVYGTVRPNNDKLTWYRTETHDGKFTLTSYQELLARQNAVITAIHGGDNALQDLDKLFAETHEQYIIMVTDHTRSPTEFSHTRPTVGVDGDGDVTIGTETYYEDGYKFYYTLSTIKPEGQSTESVYVGEAETSGWWNYSSDQEVGFVRSWKRLHHDNSDILSGREEVLHPKLEPMDDCRKRD